jgi:hypothetical protein
MGPRRVQSYLAVLLATALPVFSAAKKDDAAEPKLLSVFPSVGQPGKKFQSEVRANWIAGAHAVWFDADGLRGRVLKVEEIQEEAAPGSDASAEKKTRPHLYCASIEVEIDPAAASGDHLLRLVAAAGLSNALPFRVVREPLVIEGSAPHQLAKQAEDLTLPAIINGRLDKPGQLDYYAFQAKQGREVAVEVLRAENMDAHLAPFRPGGSWFDPDRPTRMLFEEERESDLMPVKSRGTLRIPQDGRYLIEVSSIFGKGSPDTAYVLRVALKGERGEPAVDGAAQAEWQERTFRRSLDPAWMTTLAGRSIATVGDTQPVAILPIIEGAIEHPGDVGHFQFDVQAGQKLAFEIETPALAPPLFNPRVSVVDSQDHELFSNVHRRVSVFNNNADRQVYLQGIEPKAIYTFERAGKYVLQVRDMTSRYGGPEYRYRILVRPQIAHVGEVSAAEADHLNLVRGRAKKLAIKTSHEEGFTGDVAFSFAGLPQGVAAFPSAEVNNQRAPTDIDDDADAVVPKVQTTTIVLMTAADAPLTSMPTVVQLLCRPIAEGRPGASLLVRKIPLMITAEPEPKLP